MTILLLALALPAAAAPPPQRLLADAARRVDRGDHAGALERLERIEDAELEPADEARRQRVAAEAHRLAAGHDRTPDPGHHLTLAFQAHQRCVAAEGPGQLVHAKHCARQEDLLVRALSARAAGIAASLELGGVAAPAELADRCEQLTALRPDSISPVLCTARLAWARSDAQAARDAFAAALRLEPSDERDQALAQATATLLHRLGNAEGAAELLAQVPVQARGKRLAALGTSIQVFQDRLEPLRTAAYAPDASAKAWRSWILGLAEGGLWVLARDQAAEAVRRYPQDAKVLLTAASVESRAAAAVPTDLPTRTRDQRIEALLRVALERLKACAALPDAPEVCASQVPSVQAQLDALAERLQSP